MPNPSWNDSQPAPEPAGSAQAVGPYRLLRLLGAGGMGEVFLAHDDRLDRHVAIKHARPDRSTAEQRMRFRREAWAAARIAHPAIIPIFDVLSDGSGDWIVTEFVDGPTLREVLQEQGPPAIGTAVSWAAQIADALSAAHHQGIVHRDLKAENVMLSSAGHLKIVDFGLAKTFAAGGEVPPESAPGTVLGTWRSMAPEQARGFRVDPRADLFSLGVLLYELLTGVAPFSGSSPFEILTRLATLPHEPLTSHGRAIPAPLAELVDQLLAKTPEARPENARLVKERLQALLGSAGIGGAAAPPADTGGHDDATVDAAAPEISTSFEAAADAVRGWRRWTLAAMVALALTAGGFLTAGGYRYFGAGSSEAAAEDPLALRQAGQEHLARWYRAGNVDTAIGYFQRALLLEPKSAPVLAALSRAYWYRSKIAGRDQQILHQALAVAEEAVAADPHLAAAQIGLGFAAVELGRLEIAEAAFERAEMLAPSAWSAYGRGYLANARGTLEDAEKAYREALAREESAEIHNALGTLLMRQKSLGGAENAFRRAIALAPDAVFGHRNLASVFFSRGEGSAAAAELQKAIEIEPRASLYTNLGTLLFYQGLYAESKIAFERAIDKAGEEGISTNTAILWANLGDAYRYLPGHEEDARVSFRRASQLVRAAAEAQPGNAELRSRLALYLAKAGDAAPARAELAAALAEPQRETAVRVRAVLAYEAIGDRAAALEVLAAALRDGLSIAEIEREPELSALRADPAYHRMAATVTGS